MSKQETIQEIGASIEHHRRLEIGHSARILAVGRNYCDVKSTFNPRFNGAKCLWLTNTSNEQRIIRTNDGRIVGGTLLGDGISVYKNTKVGEVLIKHHSGTHTITTTTKYGRTNTVTIDIHNGTTYSPTINSAKELTVYSGTNRPVRYRNLSDLTKEVYDATRAIEETRRKQEEARKARQEAARLEAERKRREFERLAKEEAERKRKEAEEAERKRLEEERLQEERDKAEIERLEKIKAEKEAELWNAQTFIREGNALRSQHTLDPVQEDVKRSHLYDGIPVLIEGGPGTGKTTTMIQRLKFLISRDALMEYDNPLTIEQVEALTDPTEIHNHWLFFSPNTQLLNFLRDAMREEDLKAGPQNTTILEKFCSSRMLDYGLINHESDGPFKLYRFRDGGYKPIVNDAKQAISSFRQFIVNNLKQILQSTYKLPTKEFAWNDLAIEIKALCKRGDNVEDLDALVRLFNSMRDNELSKVKKLEKDLNEELKKKAIQVKNAVDADDEAKKGAYELFHQWMQEAVEEQEEIIEEDEMDENEEEDNESENGNINEPNFDLMLYQQIMPILRKQGLRVYDSKQKLSKRQGDLYTIIKKYIDAVDIKTISSLAWFTKKFAFLCRGIESNVLNQIPRLYKLFRKDMIEKGSQAFDTKLLAEICKRKNGKYLHREEVELIIGVINHAILAIYKKSKLRFEAMKNNKYVKAYCENVKSVIGIDEATDFSIIDYYFMSSFLHYEYSSLTLCGDILQGMNADGISDWNELKQPLLFPKMEKYELRTSYRQVPTLLDMSKRIYKDSLGTNAPYDTAYERRPNEPLPIYTVSEDMDEKVRWIEHRIIEVLKTYGNKVPSIAIMVGDNVNIPELVDAMIEEDDLNGIDIFDCSGYNAHDNVNAVRIFPLSEVKGMEFEVAFFYDIDEALAGQSTDMMRRYLYVGISRATTHLAATFTKKDGNEDIIKYFDQTKHNWKL